MVKEANQGDHTPVVSIGLRYGMILFIASEVMFFVAWFWIFFEMALFHDVRTALGHRGGPHRLGDLAAARASRRCRPWHLPLVNTLTLLLSGTTVTWAHHALQHGDRKGAKIGLLLTILLGMLFTSIQAYEYRHILHEHLFFNEAAANSGLYGSAFFMATGFHGFHVLIGTIFLTVCLLRLMAGGFTPQKHFGFEAAAWYWHFVDVVWLFLFAFIYVIFGATAWRPWRRNPIAAGLAGRCPNCGEGPLFDGFLKSRPRCEACGFDLAAADSGDGPAVFVILIAGVIVAVRGPVRRDRLPPADLAAPGQSGCRLTVLVCLALLRPVQGRAGGAAVPQQGRTGRGLVGLAPHP